MLEAHRPLVVVLTWV